MAATVTMDPLLSAAADAAVAAWTTTKSAGSREWLIEPIAIGADGTPTSRLDDAVERAILDAVAASGVNILSEEIGWVDNRSDTTLVIDPVDGTGNASAGVPFSAFTAAIARDGVFVEALTAWLEGDRRWWGHVDVASAHRTTGRTDLAGAMVSMIRPKPASSDAFLAVARVADRVRILGSSSIEAALVASGALDAALDPGSDTHRIVDLAAAVVLVSGAGGAVVDVFGRPVTFTTAIEQRWSGVVAATPRLADQLCELVAPSLVTAPPATSVGGQLRGTA